MKIESYRDLFVWQKAMDLVVQCYKFVSELPKNETYGLISQVQRAAVSIPANIAEGHGRDHMGDYLRHLSIANGSLKDWRLICCWLDALATALKTRPSLCSPNVPKSARCCQVCRKALEVLTNTAPTTCHL